VKSALSQPSTGPAGIEVILTSAETGAGLDDLRAALSGGLSVFVGKSGVGKTSLLNAIEPGLGLRVQATNQTTGKGRHTTTHMQIFETEPGGAIWIRPASASLACGTLSGPTWRCFSPKCGPGSGSVNSAWAAGTTRSRAVKSGWRSGAARSAPTVTRVI
jgi:hypothetical protein